jgi:hypothetical protein
MGEKNCPQPWCRQCRPPAGQFFKKNESSPLYVLSKKVNNDYRSFPYDPIRSKMNVVRFRTIRIVRKRTMTCRHKKYTKSKMSKWNQLYREVEILGYQYLRNCNQPLINLEVLAPFLRQIIFSCFPSLVLGSYWGKTPNRPDPYTTILGNKRIDGKGDKRIIPLINRCATCGWKYRSFSNDSAWENCP